MTDQLEKLDHAIWEITRHVDDLPVECDGASWLVMLALRRSGIVGQHHEGSLLWNHPSGKKYEIPVHHWVTVGDLVVDYRIRMWTRKDAPHGVMLSPFVNLTYTSLGTIPFDQDVAELLEKAILL